MSIRYDQQSILEGNARQRDRMETPTSFTNPGGLERPGKTRMAGQMGARALELMSDPNSAQQTNDWMELFSDSNEGAAFNAAKMNKAVSMAQTEAMG